MVALVILISVSTGADGFGTAIVTSMIFVSVYMVANSFFTTVVTDMVLVAICMLTVHLAAAIVTLVILIGILTGANGSGASAVTGMVLILIYMPQRSNRLYFCLAAGFADILLHTFGSTGRLGNNLAFFPIVSRLTAPESIFINIGIAVRIFAGIQVSTALIF